MKLTMRNLEELNKLIRENYGTSNSKTSSAIDHLLGESEKAAMEDSQTKRFGDYMEGKHWKPMDAQKESLDAKFKKVYEYDQNPFLQPSDEYVDLMEEVRRNMLKSSKKVEAKILADVLSALPLYRTIKEKNGTPTVVAINGNRYVLDNRHPL